MSNKIQPNQDIIPMRVNDAKMVGPFSVTEVAPLAVAVLIGTLIGMTNYALILGFIITVIQVKLAKNFPSGFVLHYCWWQGLIPKKPTKYIPDPIRRKYFQ
ncbi:hypothetical protein UA32_11695 [Photobacterium angustum]|uniref:Type IV conjugative transfer system protein TraL n=1 Tax=Photobacterium angustum TaxID=661 RepID=A0ABX5H214_PHOAN|nr:type IV conjugative transfer system protein TraL [Photobacterium angustum]KJG37626.1 hypothetical protein UA32_11695 [Photobacterium angustum]PSX07080.1 type IV conjugative transfer system protein TraL [Photobacterium angustum]